MLDVAPHIFIVDERRGRPNILGFQSIADRLPGQLFEDGHSETVLLVSGPVSLVIGSPDATFRWRRCGWLGLAKAFWNSGSAWMNMMRPTLARAAWGMSSLFASPRLTFRNRDFRAESCPGLNDLWRSGFLATSSRAPQPQQQVGWASQSASTPALARRLAQAARIDSEREVAGRFSFSGSSVVVVIPPLKTSKIFEH